MKKLSILALAVVLVAMFTLPAAALENEFGGYWRTRFFTKQSFDGDDDDANGDSLDQSRVDTRTRLYYTAKINDNLKFVNKFEFDATWGELEDEDEGDSFYGDVDADGVAIEIKNSYADWMMGALNVRMGVQAYNISRGLVTDADLSGVIGLWKVNDMFTLGLAWARAFEDGADTSENFDLYQVQGTFDLNEDLRIAPYVAWYYSNNLDIEFFDADLADIADAGETSIYILGVDFDATFGAFSLFATAAYEGGSIDDITITGIAGEDDVDVSAYLFDVGGAFNFGQGDIHGEFIYASGQDEDEEDDLEAFLPAFGQSYYWAEIMGEGIFDGTDPAGAPGDQVSNLIAANIGATVKPMDKLSVTLDVWYAMLAEEVDDEDELGTEVDLKITYQLVEGLNLDLVGAYLFAGDAISEGGENEDDPYELGARFSLSF